jgi:Flp pilus assembly protein TadD
MKKVKGKRAKPNIKLVSSQSAEPAMGVLYEVTNKLHILIATVLAVATLIIFWQVGSHDFINYDDNVYVYENLNVSNGLTIQGILWAFKSTDAEFWHPLTWLSHMTDVELFGMNAHGHHFTSLFIHSASTVILFLLLHQATNAIWESFIVAALFAFHPLHVQSVAWIAERKDVLSTFFGFISLYFYVKYVELKSIKLYLLALLSFIFGLMSKSMLVTLPVIMLLLDIWPLSRIGQSTEKKYQVQFLGKCESITQLIKEKIPFLICSILFSAVTIYAQHADTGNKNLYAISLSLRFENAFLSYLIYIFKTFWPQNLSIFYPYPTFIPAWQWLGSIFIVLIVSTVVVWSRRRFPFLLVGWFWFILTLLPVIGFIQVGDHALADRYTYLPLIGLFIMIAWGLSALTKKYPHRRWITYLATGFLLISTSFLTTTELTYWKNESSLFNHALQTTENNSMAHGHVGSDYGRKGDMAAAIVEFKKAIAIDPNNFTIHNDLGFALSQNGDLPGAINAFNIALKLNPNYAESHNQLGVVLEKLGRNDAAIMEYKTALAINPNNLKAHKNLGVALARSGNTNAAIQTYRDVLTQDSKSFEMHNSLGVAFEKNGDIDGAINEYKIAISLNPNFSKSHNNLGMIYGKMGHLNEALAEFKAGIAANHTDAELHNNCGIAYLMNGDFNKAIIEFNEAIKIKPDFTLAKDNLKATFARKQSDSSK